MRQIFDIYQASSSIDWHVVGGILLFTDLLAFMALCHAWSDDPAKAESQSVRDRPGIRPRKRG